MLSILDWEHAWRRDRPFPFTPSVSEINGLDAALDLYLAEGPEQVWARHALTAAACRAGVLAMGLKPVAGRRAHRISHRDGRADPGNHRGRGAQGGCARTLWRRVLVGTRRDARQARAHRPYGSDRETDVCRGGRDRARRCGPRAGPSASTSAAGLAAALAVIDAGVD